jgi:hypothetical protein
MARTPISRINNRKADGGNLRWLGLLGVLVFLGILLFLAPSPIYKAGLENINEAVADSNSKQELADPEDYKDHRRPSWKTFHEKTQPGFLGRKVNNLLSWVGIKSRPNWSPGYFKYMLEKRIQERTASGRVAEYVERLVPTETSRLIVWGDLSGAYHSVVRGIQQLIKLNIIDENFVLKSKDDYILFMGDAASRSPFIMELLTLMMKLEEKNPNRVIYITGNNERKGAWYSYGLREEILAKAPELTSEEKPLYKVAEQYFETLALGVYASVPPHASKDFIRFSHFSMEAAAEEEYRPFMNLLDDAYYSTKLLEDRKVGENTIIKLSAEHGIPDPSPVSVKVIFNSYRKIKEYQKNAGLRFLVPDKGASAWTVLSSPTVFAIKVFNFKDDAFTIVQAAPKLEDWTITLWTRDIMTKEEFHSLTFNLLSGKEISSDAGKNVGAGEEKTTDLNVETNSRSNRRTR